jgi:hypothetical protein
VVISGIVVATLQQRLSYIDESLIKDYGYQIEYLESSIRKLGSLMSEHLPSETNSQLSGARRIFQNALSELQAISIPTLELTSLEQELYTVGELRVLVEDFIDCYQGGDSLVETGNYSAESVKQGNEFLQLYLLLRLIKMITRTEAASIENKNKFVYALCQTMSKDDNQRPLDVETFQNIFNWLYQYLRSQLKIYDDMIHENLQGFDRDTLDYITYVTQNWTNIVAIEAKAKALVTPYPIELPQNPSLFHHSRDYMTVQRAALLLFGQCCEMK